MTIQFDKTDQKPREIVPKKNHVARLYSVIEIGLVPNPFFGKPTPDGEVNTKEFNRIVRLTWELPNELREFDGQKKPMVIGKDFTLSVYKQSGLRKIINGMLGGISDEDAESFDLHSLIGKTCLLQTGIKEGKNGDYAIILSASELPEGLTAPDQFNESVYLDYGEGWDDATYAGLPQFLKDKMAESQEMKRRVSSSETDELAGEFDYKENDLPPSPF